ncbi:MAG: RNA polymerase sigma factor, partial [Chloroflexota bacterium]
MKKPFERVVEEHGAAVLRVCRAALGPSDCEDAWSDTFLAALRAYPDLPEDANVEAWLVTIAHRKAIDGIRARQRAPVTGEKLPERQSTIGIPREPDQELWEALAELPPKQRLAVTYHYLAGLPHAHVAALLGGSTDAARRAAADGIAALRKTYR